MDKSIELYRASDALCETMKNADFNWEKEEKRFIKLLNEFFTNPTQRSGFSSAITFKKVNEAFEDYIEHTYVNHRELCYADFVLQCRIDCFFASLIELCDLNAVEEILGTTTKIQLSDEIEDLLDVAWSDVGTIATEVAEYLAREGVNLDGMSEMTVGVDQSVMSKFIDNPGITKREGLWIRIWITHDVDNPKRLQVRVIIVPQEKGGAAMEYDITTQCKEWLDTLA